MPASPERQVFFDPSGRRWRRLKLLLLVVVVALTAGTVVSWQQIHDAPIVDDDELPRQVTISDAPESPPVLGSGPLVRVVRIARGHDGGAVAVDPLTDRALRPVTGDEAKEVGGSRVALDRYGYSTAAQRTISLTFDDGPTPRGHRRSSTCCTSTASRPRSSSPRPRPFAIRS